MTLNIKYLFVKIFKYSDTVSFLLESIAEVEIESA